jgi:hypothetical protein
VAFTTFTDDLERLVDWLLQCEVTTLALESTGVYWIPLYEIRSYDSDANIESVIHPATHSDEGHLL